MLILVDCLVWPIDLERGGYDCLEFVEEILGFPVKETIGGGLRGACHLLGNAGYVWRSDRTPRSTANCRI